MDREEFGSRIRESLVNNDISRQKLADDIGVSLRTVENWCAGKSLPDIEELQKIADTLSLPIMWFYKKEYEELSDVAKNLQIKLDETVKKLHKSELARKQWLHEAKMLGSILRNLNIEIPHYRPKFKTKEAEERYSKLMRGVFNDDSIDLDIDDENQDWIDLPEKDPRE